jgi:hypothetical protein
VRLAVHGRGGFRGRRLDQAEDLALRLGDPVAQVRHVVVALLLQVGLVRLGDVVGGNAAVDRVDIHEERHLVAPSRRVLGART